MSDKDPAGGKEAALRVGVAGLGTVGSGVIDILTRHVEMLAARTGRKIEIRAVSASSRTKNRDIDIDAFAWEDDAVALAKRDDIDTFVELIGGEDGVAKAAVEAALGSGKHVVTANKALLAHHGHALALLAEKKGRELRYEAAVAGGIPIIKSLGEGLAGNEISRISGIMNGTCNYMLTRMEEEHLDYDEVLVAARELGYLEADPTLDVGGIDAAHKLAILTALGFGVQVSLGDVVIEGIEHVSLIDIGYAARLGYRIKLICSAERHDGGIRQRVAPALIAKNSPLGRCHGVENMVVVEGDAIGRLVLAGPGAGRGATASAVIGDLCDLARGSRLHPFGQRASTLAPSMGGEIRTKNAYYIRMMLCDEIGVLAKVAECLAAEQISIDELRQLDHQGEETPLIMITHKTSREPLDRALAEIEKLDAVLGTTIAFRIEKS